MEDYIQKVSAGEDLTQAEARRVSRQLFQTATDAQIGGLLTALGTKGETEHEIAGFAEGMRDVARTIEPAQETLVDTCGTGGDEYDTINVSTTSALVAAGAGVAVAKHGNYSVSSSSGSADVLEEIGVPIEAEPHTVQQTIEEHGIGFMLAPVFHPAMKAVIGPRKELGVRTIFNILGPLTNPAGADTQVVGVYDETLVGVVARALARMDVQKALVVHGSGLDEIAVHDKTTVAEVEGETIEEYVLTPSDIGIEKHDITAVAGGDPAANAADLREIVNGELQGPKRDIVLANAGGAIYVAGEVASITDGVERARQCIDDGQAAQKMRQLTDTDRVGVHASD